MGPPILVGRSWENHLSLHQRAASAAAAPHGSAPAVAASVAALVRNPRVAGGDRRAVRYSYLPSHSSLLILLLSLLLPPSSLCYLRAAVPFPVKSPPAAL